MVVMHDKRNIFVFFVFSLFIFLVESLHKSLLPLFILLLLPSFHSVQCAASAFIFSSLFFSLLLLPSLLFSSVFLGHTGASPSTL